MGREDGEDRLSEDRRRELLDRIGRRSATIGTRIPESVTIDGTDLNLREFVVQTRNQPVVPPDQLDRVHAVRKTLAHERAALKDRLASAPLTDDEATRIADTVVGLDRAIEALEDLRARDREAEERERSLESTRSWLSLVERILD